VVEALEQRQFLWYLRNLIFGMQLHSLEMDCILGRGD
jgi:hypothetical protein